MVITWVHSRFCELKTLNRKRNSYNYLRIRLVEKEEYKIQSSFNDTFYLSTCLFRSRYVLVCILVYQLLYQLLSDACCDPRFVYTGVPGIVLSMDEYLLLPLLITNSFSFSIQTTKQHYIPLIFHYPDSRDSYR